MIHVFEYSLKLPDVVIGESALGSAGDVCVEVLLKLVQEKPITQVRY